MNRDAYLAIACGLLGLALGYAIWGTTDRVIIETPAPSVTWQDGSVTAARVVDTKPKLPAPSKPKGGKTIRTVEVTVQPVVKEPLTPAFPVPEQGTKNTQDCLPVNLRIDLDQYKDGIRASVIAENGSVVDAADYPISPLIQPIRFKWAIGIDGHALAIDRDLGRARVGVSIGDGEVRYRALVRF